MAEKRLRTGRSESELDTEGGGQAGTSQSESRSKKGHITNIYLTDSDEEVIVNFVKDHAELYDKTNTLRTRPRRNACGRDLQAAATWQ